MRLPDGVCGTVERVGAGAAAQTRTWGREVWKAVQLAQLGRHDSAILIAGLSSYLTEEQKQHLALAGACEGLAPVYRHFDSYEPRGVSNIEDLSLRMTEGLFNVVLRALAALGVEPVLSAP